MPADVLSGTETLNFYLRSVTSSFTLRGITEKGPPGLGVKVKFKREGYSTVIHRSVVYVPLSTIMTESSFILIRGPGKWNENVNGSKFGKLLAMISFLKPS
jgi:hypothetical protein